MAYQNTFRIYCVICLHDPSNNEFSYLVITTGGGLTWFDRKSCPPMVQKFLEVHNSRDYCLLLDWHNYVVFCEHIPPPYG